MSYETLLYEKRGGIATVTINRPEKRNAWTTQVSADVVEVFRAMEDDPEVLVTVLTGAGDKAFSAGADLGNPNTHRVATAGDHLATVSPRGFAVFNAVTDYPKPVVAAVNGAAVAGGCLLALTADWRVARRGASMGLNEVKVGVPLPWSAVLLLKTASPAFAQTAVALLGRNFEGDAAVASGLAHEAVDDGSFEATVADRLAEFAEKDAYAFGVTKGYLRGAAVASMRDRDAALLDEFMDGWFSEGTQARIQKAVAALKDTYASRPEAMAGIEARLRKFYADREMRRDGVLSRTVSGVQAIYEQNVFPAMKVGWGTYPNNIGHVFFTGCFRCHDDNHKARDGSVIKQDCESCHAMP